jgi:hypothetical protein
MDYPAIRRALSTAESNLAKLYHDPDCAKFAKAADDYLRAYDAHSGACNKFDGSVLVTVPCRVAFVEVPKEEKQCVMCCYSNLHDCEREGEEHPECHAEHRKDGREGIFVVTKYNNKKKPEPQPGYRTMGDLYACPKCGHHMRANVIGGEKRCWAKVPRTGPRAKGEPRMVTCGAKMVYCPHQ